MTPEAGLQRLLLALAIRGDVLAQAPEAVTAEAFGLGVGSPTPQQRLATVVTTFFEKYETRPPVEYMEQAVAEERTKLGPAERDALANELKVVLATEIPEDPAWIYDKARQWADTKRIDQALNRAQQALQATDPVQGAKAAREAMGRAMVLNAASDLRLVPLSSITLRKYRFVWTGRVPRRQLSLLAGNPGYGKTMTMVDAAARITTGQPFPDGALNQGPANVVFLTREDGAAETLGPRLLAAGGNPERMFVVASDSTATMADDIAAIETAVKRVGAVRLIVFDPLNDFIPKKTDRHAEVEVREALTALNDLAARLDIGIVGIMHLNKKADHEALQRVLGSVAYGAVVRVVHMVVPMKEEPGVRVYLAAKFNIGPFPFGLKFKMGAQVEVGKDPDPDPGDDGIIWAAPIEWLEERVTETADELLQRQQINNSQRGRPPAQREQAVALLQEILANGPVPANVVEQRLELAGVTRGTWERAKRVLGVESVKTGSGPWMWTLPAPAIIEGPGA